MHPEEYQTMREQEEAHWFYLSTHAAALRALGGVPDGARVCDAGCGTGGLLARLCRRFDAVGADLARSAVRTAAQRAGLAGRLAAARIEALPFPDAAFDALTCIDTLYHAQVDEAAALREFRRVLRPGGRLVVQAAAFESLRGPHDLAVHTRRRYRLGEMARFVETAGFRIVQSRYRYAPLFLPLLLRRRLWRREGRGEAGAPQREQGSDLRASSLGGRLDALLAKVLEAEEAISGPWVPFGCSVFVVGEAQGAPTSVALGWR